ncbi:MAG: hypothetical protein HY597_05490 [Candidatus Omnitrophica bacterium]|nr:hypothetical protein [Candidatus Omnitrophota bacterium]
MWMWNDLEFLSRTGKAIPLISAAAAFLAVVGVQFAGLKINGRVEYLRKQADLERKRTPPKVDVDLALSEKGNLFVVLQSGNSVPFKANWVVVTKGDKIVGGFMLDWTEHYPTPEKQQWQFKVSVQRDELVENYLELRLNHVSVYSSEWGDPKELSGRIVKKYVWADGGLKHVE